MTALKNLKFIKAEQNNFTECKHKNSLFSFFSCRNCGSSRHVEYMRILLILLMSFSLNVAAAEKESPTEVFKAQRISQGEIFFDQATQYYQDKMYETCIEKLLDFQILFPGHPWTVKAQKLLSQAYEKNEQWDKSVQVDLKIHKENSSLEEGLSSYLDAAKKMAKMGKTARAAEILEYLKTQMYSNKLAKDAEIELDQMRILGLVKDVKSVQEKEKQQ